MTEDDSEPNDLPRARRPDRGDLSPEDSDDRHRRPRRDTSDDVSATDFLIPSGSGFAIFALYGGLVGLCLPLLGLVFAVPALVCGIIALRRWRRSNSYGNATSNIRAILGVILSGLGVLVWGGFLVAALVSSLLQTK